MCWAEFLTGIQMRVRGGSEKGVGIAGHTGTVLGKSYCRRAMLHRPLAWPQGALDSTRVWLDIFAGGRGLPKGATAECAEAGLEAVEGRCDTAITPYLCQHGPGVHSRSCHADAQLAAATAPRLKPPCLFRCRPAYPCYRPLATRHQSTSTPVSELGRPQCKVLHDLLAPL